MKAARTADMAGVRFEGKKKVWFLSTPEELSELVRTVAEAGYTGRLVIQELVPGDDTAEGSITAYADAAGRVTLLCSARVLLGEHPPDALGRPAAMITTEFGDALPQARALLEATGYRGFANFDVKLDASDGQWKFFEVNPVSAGTTSTSPRRGRTCPASWWQMRSSIVRSSPSRRSTRSSTPWCRCRC